MCHPGARVVRLRDSVAQNRNRWLVLQQASMVAAAAERVTMQEPEVVAVGAAAAARGGSMKQCMCSPTKHPGSFRCRHHHAGYVWGGRVPRAQASN